jgi:hypothetical protein
VSDRKQNREDLDDRTGFGFAVAGVVVVPRTAKAYVALHGPPEPQASLSLLLTGASKHP